MRVSCMARIRFIMNSGVDDRKRTGSRLIGFKQRVRKSKPIIPSSGIVSIIHKRSFLKQHTPYACTVEILSVNCMCDKVQTEGYLLRLDHVPALHEMLHIVEDNWTHQGHTYLILDELPSIFTMVNE